MWHHGGAHRRRLEHISRRLRTHCVCVKFFSIVFGSPIVFNAQLYIAIINKWMDYDAVSFKVSLGFQFRASV